MTRTKRTRQLAAYQRERRQQYLNDTLHQVAILEGRLMAALSLNLTQLEQQVLGSNYLAPWEKLDALTAKAAEVGV